MIVETNIISAPSHWACYLINGDASDMTQAEMDAADAYFGSWDVLDVMPASERFSWYFREHGGNADGGELVDYLVYTP